MTKVDLGTGTGASGAFTGLTGVTGLGGAEAAFVLSALFVDLRQAQGLY